MKSNTFCWAIYIKYSCRCWKDWIQSVCLTTSNNNHTSSDKAVKDILVRLSDLEIDFLLDCLSSTGIITLILADNSTTGIPKQDLVVLAPPMDPIVGEGGRDENNIAVGSWMSHQVMASWWELSNAQSSLERCRMQWSNQADSWVKRALQEKKKEVEQNRGQRGSLASFKIHKLLLTKLEHSERLLLNLERARQALEESWHQREVFEALETSTKTLRALRLEADQNDIETLIEAYQDELGLIESTNNSLATMATMATDGSEEATLLIELEKLTLDDAVTADSSCPSQASGKQDTFDSSVKPSKGFDSRFSDFESSTRETSNANKKVLVPG